MSENKQTALAFAVLVTFSVLFAAGLWYADHPGPRTSSRTPTPAAGAPRPARSAITGIVRWDTALVNEIGAPPRAPYALCQVWRGQRVTVTDVATIDDGRRHFLALTDDGCIGWISDDALDQY